MKQLLTTILSMLFIGTVLSQNLNPNCSNIKGKKGDTLKVSSDKEIPVKLTATNKDALMKFLQFSFFQVDGDPATKKTFEVLGKDSAAKKNMQLNSFIKPVTAGQPNGPVQISLTLKLSTHFPDKNSFLVIFSCDGTKADTIPFALNNAPQETLPSPPNTAKKDLPYLPVTFISAEMMKSIQNGSACNLCDDRLKAEIDSRKDRHYSTDYIVLFDPILKKDAYTICKHIFRKASTPNKILERYKKVGAKWFAPSVGSQIRFEVVNQPLTESRRITVDAIDVFNNGASQFQGIINSQVNAGIISKLNPSAATPADDATISENVLGEEEDSIRPATDAEKLQMLHSQLVDYTSVFRLSSCTIDEHMRNLPKIIASINTAFGTTASGSVALTLQLKNKFADSTGLISTVDEIGNLLGILKDLKPLAYTTLRAKNRDYLVVKTYDANNTEIGSENIRLSGGLKIDFSAGFVLTGLRDFSYILKDTSVKYQPDPDQTSLVDTSGNIIIKENIGKRQIGIGILTHIYPRISSDYNLGVTVGLMSSTELDLRFMLGGSLMLSSLFGSNNRVSFSGGVVWGKVKRLSNAYYEGYKVINDKPVFYPGTTAITTVAVPITEHSWFFAVTMNFGGN